MTFKDLIFVVAMLALMLLAGFLNEMSRTENLATAGCFTQQSEAVGSKHHSLFVTFSGFDPARRELTGTGRIEFQGPPGAYGEADGATHEEVDRGVRCHERTAPRPFEFPEKIPVSLVFMDQIEEEPDSYRHIGGAEKVLELTAQSRWKYGASGKVELEVTPVREGLFYPFDKYKVSFVAQVSPLNTDHGFVGEPGYVELRYYVPGLRIEGEAIDPVPAGAQFEMTAIRPLVPRIVAAVFVALALFWLSYLAFHATPETHVANLVGFFVGVWGYRSTLVGEMGGVETAVGYMTLSFSVLAVAIVLVRWVFRTPAATAVCTYCTTQISPDAKRCPQCAQDNPFATKPGVS